MTLTDADLNNQEGIDLDNPGKYQTLLEDLQGNILKGHGRDHSVHLFLKFKLRKQADVKTWIQGFANNYVTSALLQANEAREYRVNKTTGSIFANFFLSIEGYEYLDVPPFKIPGSQPFRFGMKNESIKNYLGDPEVEKWDSGLQGKIHALILLADDNVAYLNEQVDQIAQDLQTFADIVQREDGFVLRNTAGQVIEHFGFADGISQPLFVKRDIEQALEDSGSFDRWDPKASLNLVLAKDPNGQTEDSYGSYLVYRKLEQNVKGFWDDQRKLAGAVGVNDELAGALIVGRFADGTPVVDSNVPTGATQTNNFNYAEDPQDFGLTPKPTKCPFHAHIRKTNPRGDTGRVESSPDLQQQSLEIERGHRIARRGISYGVNDISQEPEAGSGLLFLCFQANPENQFNFIQGGWANQNNFVAVNVGLDPVIGQPGPDKNQKWPKTWGDPDTEEEPYNFTLWVNMKGGEYFFTPSISYLKNISDS